MPEPIEFLFDSGAEGWTKDGGVASVTQAVYNDNGNGNGNSLNVLQADFSWTATDENPYFAANIMKNLDLSSYSKIVVKARIDSDISGMGVKPFIKVTSDWSWRDGGYSSIDEDGFTTITFDLSGISAQELKTAKAIGVQFVTPNGTAGSATAYIDEVKVLP